MSQKLLIIVISFNLIMSTTTFFERKYAWTLYWFAAALLNTAVWWMKK